MTRTTPIPEVVTVTGLSHDGRGVARGDGKTLFVEGALPGEEVTFTITRSRSRFIEASVREVLKAAPERVTPPCPHYNHCGGCNLQHLAPGAQLEAKQKHLSDTLQRVGALQPKQWLDPVCSQPWAYRARARLAVAAGRKGAAATLGFRREGSRAVEALSVCPVLEPSLERLIGALSAAVARLEHPERISQVWLASSESRPGLAVQAVAGIHPPDREVLQQFCRQHGVDGQFSGADGSWPEAGEPLRYRVSEAGPEIRFQPWHFTQANRGVNRKLVEQVIQLLDPAPGHRVLDLFCGLGNFSLPIAQRCAHVTGVEGDAALVEGARSNAANNLIRNAEFVRSDLAEDLSGVAWASMKYDLVVLDPPRTGAAALVPLLGRLGARRVCYISCDAATLARDARELHRQSKLRLQSAGVLDMFPQTSHFESVALFA